MTTVLGIDEAGRGPVIGPIVLCGVRASAAERLLLGALGVRDSKVYGGDDSGRAARAALAALIKEKTRVLVVIASAAEVDRWVEHGGLNRLEQKLARRIIADAGPTARIVADGKRLFSPLQKQYPHLEALDRAEETEVTVAAASIVAKDVRDSALSAIYADYQAEFGPIRGGGYPNRATERFLRAYRMRFGRLPAEVRRSWSWRVLAELEAVGTTPEAAR